MSHSACGGQTQDINLSEIALSETMSNRYAGLLDLY